MAWVSTLDTAKLEAATRAALTLGPSRIGFDGLLARNAVTGKASAAYASLQRTLLALPHVDGAAAVWGQTLLGEISHRRGDSAAEGHFRVALSAGDKDLYLLGAYCDWLLDQGRAAEVIPLLQNENESLDLFHATRGGEAALARRHRDDAIRAGTTHEAVRVAAE